MMLLAHGLDRLFNQQSACAFIGRNPLRIDVTRLGQFLTGLAH
jgi:hypothetical protein